MKKILGCALALLLLMGCGATAPVEAEADTVLYVDDLGRQVEIPAQLDAVVPAGTVAQMMIYAVAPEKLAGLASSLSEVQVPYYPDSVAQLPVFGSFYGGSSTTNYEAIIQAQPDLIIDIGEVKTDIVADLDEFSEKTGIPIIFIEGQLDTMGDAFGKLGSLFGDEEAGAQLEAYCDKVMVDLGDKKGDGVSVLYASTSGGVQIFGRNTVQVEVMERVGAVNACPTDAVAGNGADTINMEEVLSWDVDMILVDGDKDEILNDPVWQELPAVEAGQVYTIPTGPYQFLGRPPAVQQFLGIQWLGNFLYPETFDFDMIAEVQEFYSLFFHYDLTTEEAEVLLAP